ncbi:GNAT family N-acetyltransferase [Corynebacterium ammoniagenes]|jgi:hypothetical protein|nr:GNAT family N-acetyltransferase [Corynebacterium ammoniagenes]APT83360.1 acetyltransferase [Corynebacterium ammoniagenes DSM 20306]AQS74373.1 N-acetyltransferase [Corynebacterium ammoniagenes]EFG81223.1 hypothetical protein HMPREF0281_01390 [Corynebacterium ammoniagenes DSM 20306]NMF32258.1 N-acetyltransferase [Corynebacterium ammoniagenes]
MTNEVTHNTDRKRFVLTVDGETAGFADYVTPSEDVRDFNHTVINPDFRGQGLSSPLVKAALDDTREAGLKAVASCSAVQHFVNKNPEYEDLIRR